MITHMKKIHIIFKILVIVALVIIFGYFLFQNLMQPQVSINHESSLHKSTRANIIAVDWPNYKQTLENGIFSRTVDSLEATYNYHSNNVSILNLEKKIVGNVSANKIQSYLDQDWSLSEEMNGGQSEELSSQDIYPNDHFSKLYFVAYVTYPDNIPTEFSLYETDFYGKSFEKIADWIGYAIEIPRFSPDKLTFSFSVYDMGSEGKIIGYDFYVIDLVSKKIMFSFRLPGDVYTQNKNAKNIVGAYRLVDENILEFTRYFARGNKSDSYTQISDKELWSYNRSTDEMILLETIPLK